MLFTCIGYYENLKTYMTKIFNYILNKKITFLLNIQEHDNNEYRIRYRQICKKQKTVLESQELVIVSTQPYL